MKFRYDFSDYKLGTDFNDFLDEDNRYPFSSTELILIKCYQCHGDDHSAAYKCSNTKCPLWLVNNKYMPKQHNLSKDTIDKMRQQIIINTQTKNN